MITTSNAVTEKISWGGVEPKPWTKIFINQNIIILKGRIVDTILLHIRYPVGYSYGCVKFEFKLSIFHDIINNLFYF